MTYSPYEKQVMLENEIKKLKEERDGYQYHADQTTSMIEWKEQQLEEVMRAVAIEEKEDRQHDLYDEERDNELSNEL